jgi:hypothetical protein
VNLILNCLNRTPNLMRSQERGKFLLSTKERETMLTPPPPTTALMLTAIAMEVCEFIVDVCWCVQTALLQH